MNPQDSVTGGTSGRKAGRAGKAGKTIQNRHAARTPRCSPSKSVFMLEAAARLHDEDSNRCADQRADGCAIPPAHALRACDRLNVPWGYSADARSAMLRPLVADAEIGMNQQTAASQLDRTRISLYLSRD
jgi:hypothetical protein